VNPAHNALIDGLVDDLTPVRPLRFAGGMATALVVLAATTGLVAAWFGLRPDLAAGDPAPLFLIASGLFLLLGLAASVTVTVMATPRVGTHHEGWRWAAAMAGLLPGAALLLAARDPAAAWAQSMPAGGVQCLAWSLALGLATALALTIWLRRGAPTAPDKAGMLTGIAAGCAGVFAFSLSCPADSIIHIGLWHGGAVMLSALAGWLVVPRLVRW